MDDPLVLGLLVALCTLGVLFSGVSVANGLLIVSAGFLLAFDGLRSLELLPEIFYGKLDSFALLSIPMFIIMGAAISSTRAGADLYEALERWLTRVPGGLVISNLGACALFAAMSGSSPATCGCRRLYRGRRHARYPYPAIGHHDRLRYRDRNLDRPLVSRRCHSRLTIDAAVYGLVAV